MTRRARTEPRATRGADSAAAVVALAGAGGVWVATMIVTVGVGLLAGTFLPAVSATIWALLAVEVLFGVSLAVAPLFGTWRQLGLNRKDEWHNLSLLWLPLAVAVSPLVLGVRPVAATELLVLVVGYTLTGIAEELIWRGFTLRLLAPLGQVRAVVIAAALFGAAHLGNIVYRDNVALVVAQAWGAFCFGLAYGALRHRIATIVPLMMLHALTDLAAAVGNVPKIPILVAEDVVLLCLGIVLLAHARRRAPLPAAPSHGPTDPPKDPAYVTTPSSSTTSTCTGTGTTTSTTTSTGTGATPTPQTVRTPSWTS